MQEEVDGAGGEQQCDQDVCTCMLVTLRVGVNHHLLEEDHYMHQCIWQCSPDYHISLGQQSASLALHECKWYEPPLAAPCHCCFTGCHHITIYHW